MRSRYLWCALYIVACSRSDRAPAREPPADVVDAAGASPAHEQPRVLASADARVAQAPDAGEGMWSWFARKDDVPLCAFADETAYGEASFLKDVKNSAALRARQPIVFGTYAPGCASRDCVRRPTLQCWTELEGDTISIHTRYSGQHRDESACTTHCEPVTAACRTPPLEPGRYRLQYGDRVRVVKLPGVLRPACLRADVR